MARARSAERASVVPITDLLIFSKQTLLLADQHLQRVLSRFDGSAAQQHLRRAGKLTDILNHVLKRNDAAAPVAENTDSAAGVISTTDSCLSRLLKTWEIFEKFNDEACAKTSFCSTKHCKLRTMRISFAARERSQVSAERKIPGSKIRRRRRHQAVAAAPAAAATTAATTVPAAAVTIPRHKPPRARSDSDSTARPSSRASSKLSRAVRLAMDHSTDGCDCRGPQRRSPCARAASGDIARPARRQKPTTAAPPPSLLSLQPVSPPPNTAKISCTAANYQPREITFAHARGRRNWRWQRAGTANEATSSIAMPPKSHSAWHEQHAKDLAMRGNWKAAARGPAIGCR